jgi:hypothetical protein
MKLAMSSRQGSCREGPKTRRPSHHRADHDSTSRLPCIHGCLWGDAPRPGRGYQKQVMMLCSAYTHMQLNSHRSRSCTQLVLRRRALASQAIPCAYGWHDEIGTARLTGNAVAQTIKQILYDRSEAEASRGKVRRRTVVHSRAR